MTALVSQELIDALTEDSNELGVVARRLYPDSPTKIFVGVRKPQNHTEIYVETSIEADRHAKSSGSSTGFSFFKESFLLEGVKRLRFGIRMTNLGFRTLFFQLANDIASEVKSATTEVAGLRVFINRIESWRRFFQNVSPDGLDRYYQQALYTELWTLKEYVLPNTTAESAILAWAGPTGANQDFQFGNSALEVKSSSANTPRINISNQFQLDDSQLDSLMLIFFSVNLKSGQELTLPNLVEAIRLILANAGYESANRFEQLLIEAGYTDLHAHYYSATEYIFRDITLYRVHNGFPRILAATVPSGVEKLQYEIDPISCKPFTIELHHISELFRGVE